MLESAHRVSSLFDSSTALRTHTVVCDWARRGVVVLSPFVSDTAEHIHLSPILAGSHTRKVDPRPTSLVTVTDPPSIARKCLTI